ncbi:MAG: DUF4878 domain-containing protein [Proteobacteria bacterium]|nr:DUF4878 domain-containing protein [Pseudomonadota bacterium]MBU1611834.1 DUF4878 domain-containing protein [Pseudomonadota bacterium]
MIRTLLACLLLALPLLGGCGGPGPDEVVKSYMQALATLDIEGMAGLSCPAVAVTIRESSQQIDAAREAGMVINVQELAYELISEGEVEAIVRVTGTVVWAGAEEDVDEDLTLVLVEDEWKLCEDFR